MIDFEGKVSNQAPRTYIKKIVGSSLKCFVNCAKCNKEIPYPLGGSVMGLNDSCFLLYSYLTTTEDKTDYYIYQSRKGNATCYCSMYCRDKHNHRF